MFSGLPSNGALPFYLSNGGRGYGCMGLAFGRPPEMALVGFKVAFECPHPSSHRQSDYNTFHPLCSMSLSLPREDQAFFRRRKPSGFGGSGFTSQASGLVNYKRDVGVWIQNLWCSSSSGNINVNLSLDMSRLRLDLRTPGLWFRGCWKEQNRPKFIL